MGQVSGTLQIKAPYPPQVAFYKSTARFTAYGGARGGGKSYAMQAKASLLAVNYAGIQILLMRRTLPELRENHTIPLQKMLHGVAIYREQTKEFLFPNGSRIVLGYCANEADVLQYQGQAYDAIFMDEATLFTEFQFMAMTESNRSSGLCKKRFLPRMYFTCNPGGVGHEWVKRLFVDRQYKQTERAEDYVFIRACVRDNTFLMEHSPDYVRALENLPTNRRKAMLEGDWDIFVGQYFDMWRREVHVVRPFLLPAAWRRYVTLDYGRDMLAAYFIALDEGGRGYVYKELYESGLLASRAAERILEMQTEEISAYYAPPDLWNKHADTGRSTADIFAESGIGLVKAHNDRVQGWLDLAEWLKADTDEQGVKAPRLRVFESCPNLIRTLPALQYDSHNPNDTAREPHELTHAPDALRYFVAGRPLPSVAPIEREEGYRSYEEQVGDLMNFGG